MGVRLEIGRVGRLAGLAVTAESATASAQDGAQRAAKRAAHEVECAAIELARLGFPRHAEPAFLDQAGSAANGTLSYPLWNDTALHYLRRIAVHLWAEGRVPAPGDVESLEDPLCEEYYDACEDEALGDFWERARESAELELDFPHLCIHADDSGWYLPIEFPEPVLVEQIAGDAWVGSCVSLAEECHELAGALELDLGRDPRDAEVQEAARRSEAGQAERGGERWRRYGIEAHTCLSLAHAARVSLETHSALCLVREREGRGAGRGRR